MTDVDKPDDDKLYR